MYEIYLETSAEKDIRKLPSDKIKNVVSKIKELSKSPYPPGSKKIKNTNNFWRIRIGNYRVIYEVLQSEKRINIYKVRHRKDVYK